MFKLKTNTRELIIRDGEEEGYFDLCCGILLGIGAETQLAKTPQGKLPPIEPPQEESTPEKESMPAVNGEKNCFQAGVSGFLHLVCEHCGAVKTFCKKNKMEYYKCNECGEKMELEKAALRRVWVNCECGEDTYYLTNSIDGAFDINCIRCGAPVAVEWNSKKKCYVTIQEG